METVDRARVALAIYPELLKAHASRGWTARATANVIAASAEGNPFPTNLDADAPINELAPPSQATTVHTAIAAGWSVGRLGAELAAHVSRQRSHGSPVSHNAPSAASSYY